jgi:hypothetical protein
MLSWRLWCMACHIYTFLVTAVRHAVFVHSRRQCCTACCYLYIPGDCAVRLAGSIHSW